jgi:hypothetical protein
MTTKAGYYGSDAVANRFPDPKTNEAYFTLVNEQTGEIEIYNEEFLADKRVGTLNTDGTIEYNENWWGGANENDKAFVEGNLPKIREKANEMVQKTTDLSPAETKELLKGNKATKEEIEIGRQQQAQVDALQSGNPATNAAGTRIQFGTYIYPQKISPTQDILQFDMLKYRPKKFNEKQFGFEDRQQGTSIGTVILPIPAGIADNQAVSWGPDNMNAIQAAVAKAALDGIMDSPGAAVDSLVDSARKVARNSGEAKSGLARAIAGMASGNQNMIARTTGAILNPNMELLFNAPQLRPFNFSFVLSPRSKEEAKIVMKIIRFFKQGMAPIRSKSNLFLKSPHTFQLKYKFRGEGGREHPYLNKFKECALQSFGVQYTPSGNYSTYDDGVMTQYQVTMTFTELEPIFNDDYGKSDLAEIGF